MGAGTDARPGIAKAAVVAWAALITVWWATIAGPRLATLGHRLVEGWSIPTVALLAGNLGRHLGAVGLAAGIGILCAAAGVITWPWLRPRAALRVLRPFALVPLGAIAVSLLLLGLLVVNLWFPAVMIGAISLPLVSIVIRRVLPTASPEPAASSRSVGPFAMPLPGDPARIWMRVAVAGAVGWLPWALAPETQPDGYEYFLAGPERWLRHHGFSTTGASAPQHYPALAEVLFAFPVMTGLEGSAKLLNAVFLMSGVFGFLAVVAESAAGWWAGVAVAVTCVSGGWFFGTGKNEGFGAGYLLLALAFGWSSRGSRSALWLSAVFAGGSLSTKLLAALNLAWVPLVIIPAWWGRGFGQLGCWGLIAALVASPWWIRAWMLTGDPWFPVLSATLPWLREGRDARHAEVWRLASGSFAFRPGFIAGTARDLVTEHASAAFMLPLALARPGKFRGMGWAAIAAYTFAHTIFLPQQLMRWMFPTVVPALLLAASSMPGWVAGVRWRGILCGGLVAAGWLMAVAVRGADPNPLPYFFGAESAASYSARYLTTFSSARAYLAHRPGPGAILLSGEVREYRLGRPGRMGYRQASGDPPIGWSLTHETASADRLAIRFRQLGIGAVLVNPIMAMNGAVLFTPFSWTRRQAFLWGEFISRWWELVFVPPARDHANGCHYVYSIRRVPLAKAAGPLLHLPGAESEVIGAASRPMTKTATAALGLLRSHFDRLPRVVQFNDIAGSIARDAGEFATALEYTRESVDRGWISDDNFSGHAVAAMFLRRFDEAVRALRLVRTGYPGWEDWANQFLAEARFHQALALLRSERPAAAERAAAEAITDLPSSRRLEWQASRTGLLHAIRALAFMQQGRTADARTALAQAALGVPEVGPLSDPGALAGFLSAVADSLLPAPRRAGAP